MRGHLFLNQNEYLTVEEFHLIRNMDLPQDFLDFLEIGFRTGLRSKDILSLKRENIDLQKERIIGTPQKTNLPMDVALDKTSLSILKRHFEKAQKNIYPDLLIHKDITSIRRGNRDFLYMHDVSVAEIEYRQCFRSSYDDDLYVEDQSDSLYVINTFLK